MNCKEVNPITDKTQSCTARGKVVADEQIQHLADEAEAGYDTAALRRTVDAAL